MTGDLRNAVVRILDRKGDTAGAGFVVTDGGLIATCAHVIFDPSHTVELVFAGSDEKRSAHVEHWRDPAEQDVAVLRLAGKLPESVHPVLLGSSGGVDDHVVKTFGFPEGKETDGIPGTGTILGWTTDSTYRVLGLRSQEISTGFSGGPALDTATQRVIGMITSILRPDRFGRNSETAFITPVETIREICPELQFHDICPYKGLQAFAEADAAWFFGRDTLIQRLLQKLKGEPTFLALLGPSGSGKSSLVQAGLIPNLKRGRLPGSQRWGMVLISPSRDPWKELSDAGMAGAENLKARAATWLDGNTPCEHLVLIIDQFEEVFTSCTPKVRNGFLESAAELLDADLPVSILLTMRDEFYPQFTREAPALVPWLERGMANIPSTLSPTELVEIIEKPVKSVGLQFEPHLVETIVNDTLEIDHAEAGRVGRSTVLPLLEFTLTQLWELREDGVLTHEAYRNRIFGVTGALTNWADREYRKIAPEQRPLVFRIVTDLVHLGDDSKATPDTRRRRPAKELWRNENERNQVGQIMQQLVAARLLVTTGDNVELIHEALLREWGLLRRRLQEDRKFLDWRQRMENRVTNWAGTDPDRHNRDKGMLLRGRDLSEAEQWLLVRGDDLSHAERDYVQQSLVDRDALQARELEQKQELQQALARAERQLAITESQRLAFAARALGTSRPETALLLACEAVHWDHNPLTEELLRDTLDRISWEVVALEGHRKGVNSASFRGDGNTLLTASDDGTACLWNLRGKCLVRLAGHQQAVTTATFSPDQKSILTASEDGTARLWDLDGNCIRTFTYPSSGHHSRLTRGAFSPDGKLVLVCDYDQAWLWRISGELVPTDWDARPKLSAYRARLQDDQLSFDNDEDERICSEGHSKRIFSAAFSYDSRFVVTASEDGEARIWSPRRKRQTILRGHEDMVVHAIFSPDGNLVLTGSVDKTARLWSADGKLIAVLSGHAADVGHLAFSPDGNLILTAVPGGGTRDPSLRLWTTAGELVTVIDTGHTDWIRSVAFSPDGKRILTGSSDETAKLFDVDGRTLEVFRGHLGRVEDVAFSGDGNQIVTASGDATARLWRQVGPPLPKIAHHHKPVTHAIYISRGTRVLLSSMEGTTTLCDIYGECQGIYRGVCDLTSACVSRDERLLLTVVPETKEVLLWELPDIDKADGGVTRKSKARMRSQGEGVPLAILGSRETTSTGQDRNAVFSPRGDRILTWRQTAELWDRHGNLIAALEGPNQNLREKLTVDFASFNSDGNHIVTASINGSVWVWDSQGQLISSFLTDGASAWDNLFSIAIAPDRNRILTTVRQMAMLWDFQGKLLCELPCATNKVKRGLYFPGGDRILTVAEGAMPEVRLWDSEGQLICRLAAKGGEWNPIAFDKDGESICIVDEGNIMKVWDREGQQIAQFVAQRGTSIRRVSFSPNRELLLTASSSGVAQLWSIPKGNLQATLKGHTTEVNSVAFSPDGKRVLTASSDGTVRQFLVEMTDLIARTSLRTARTLNREEIAEFNVQMPLRFDAKQISVYRTAEIG